MYWQEMLKPEPFTYAEWEAPGAQLEGEWQGEVNRSRPDYVRWVQQSLNRIMGLRLAVDGVMGPATRSAVRSFQQKQGLAAYGVVGPQTETALKTALGAKRPQRLQAAVPVLSRGRAFPVAMRRTVVSASRPPVVQQLPPSPFSQVPTPTRATPRALTYSTKDVIDKRISVPAQHALVRLSKNPATSADAVGMLEEVKAGGLAGIYCVNWEKAAQRALRLGKTWWTVISKGEDGVLMLDPDNSSGGQPLIAFRRELDPDCGLLKGEPRFAASHSRLDAALLRAWQAYLHFRRREIVPCIPATHTRVANAVSGIGQRGTEPGLAPFPTWPRCCRPLTIVAWAGGFPRFNNGTVASDDFEAIADRSRAELRVRINSLPNLLDLINSLPAYAIKKLFLIGHIAGPNRVVFTRELGKNDAEKRSYDEQTRHSLGVRNLESQYVSGYITRNQLRNRFAGFAEIVVVACRGGQDTTPLIGGLEDDTSLFAVMAEKFGVCVKGFRRRVCIIHRSEKGRIVERGLLMYPPLRDDACLPLSKSDRSRIVRRVEELAPDCGRGCPDTDDK